LQVLRETGLLYLQGRSVKMNPQTRCDEMDKLRDELLGEIAADILRREVAFQERLERADELAELRWAGLRAYRSTECACHAS
jgi:hypothetical protein